MIRRKVICVFGKFDGKSDFILEPVCCLDEDKCECEYCKDSFWIDGEEQCQE